jgi:tetratricopeptide (TPR) repeat protein
VRASGLIVLALLLAPPGAGAAAATRDHYGPALATVDTLYVHGRSAEAGARLDSLLAAARSRGLRGFEAAILARRAGAELYFRRYDGASRDADSAIALARAQRDTLTWCRALLAKGRSALYQDRVAEAGAPYRELRRLADAIGDRSQRGNARLGLAYLDLQASRADRAAAGYRAAVRLLGGGVDLGGELTARVGLARAVRAQGRPGVAREIYRTLIARCVELGELRNQADAWNNLGAIEQEGGDQVRAWTCFERALDCNRRMGRPTGDQVLNLAILMTRRGQFERARADLERELERNPGVAWSETRYRLQTQLAIVLAYLNRRVDAERMLRELWALRDSVPAEAAGNAGIALGNWLDAARLHAEAFRVLDLLGTRYRSRLASDQLALVEIDLARAELGLGRPAAALARARACWRDTTLRYDSEGTRLAAGLTLARSFVATGLGDSARALVRGLADDLERFRATSRDAQWSVSLGASGADLAVVTARVLLDSTRAEPVATRIDETFDALQRLKARGFTRAGSGFTTASRMRASVLRDGELFLDLFGSGLDSSLVVTAIARNSPSFAALTPSHDPGLLVRAHGVYDSRDPTDAAMRRANAAGALRTILGPSLEPVLGARRIYFSPNSAQVALPLAAMLEELRPGHAPEVVIVPSASWLAASRTLVRVPAGPARVVAVSRYTDAGGRDLPGAREEMAWLRSRYGAEVFAHAGDRELADVRPWLTRGTILHVAAHSRTSTWDPWNSALLLGRGNEESAWLTLSDIARGTTCAPLVMLASCNTTIGSNLGNESIYGIASGFLAAGARTTISTLWDADDRATARFTRAFYAALERGATAIVALRSAQRVVAADPATHEPYFWAGFVLVGDPDLAVKPAIRGPR